MCHFSLVSAFVNTYISHLYVSLIVRNSASVAQNFCFLLLLTCFGCVCQSLHPPDISSYICSFCMFPQDLFFYLHVYRHSHWERGGVVDKAPASHLLGPVLEAPLKPSVKFSLPTCFNCSSEQVVGGSEYLLCSQYLVPLVLEWVEMGALYISMPGLWSVVLFSTIHLSHCPANSLVAFKPLNL